MPREFAAKAADVTQRIAAAPAVEVHPLVAAKFATAPASMTEVAARYGELLADVNRQWQELTKAAADGQQPAPPAFPDAALEALRQVLFSPRGPCEVPDEPIVNIEYYFDSASCDALWKLQNEVDNWILQAPPTSRHAIALTDREVPMTPYIFKRGNPANRETKCRGSSSKWSPARVENPSPRQRRLELAQAIDRSGQSAHCASDRQPRLDAPLRRWARAHAQRLRHAGRNAEPLRAARLAHQPLH
jgi:hypothetical protein